LELYVLLAVFGKNIIASEGEEWKKYRKIAAPAFSEVRSEHMSSPIKSERNYQRNNKLVWDETIRIMMDMFENVWGDRSEVVVDHCLDVTLPVRFLWLRLCPYPKHLHQIALFVIGVAGTLMPRSNCGSLMTAGTRVRLSGHMDN
jgi:hypothetical protein